MTPDALARVHGAAFTTSRGWTASEFAALLGTRGVILCGDVRSFVLGRVTLDEAEILTVATDPAYQRQGLARATLNRFERAVANAGAVRIFLEVSAQNGRAKSLYTKEEYREIGRRRNYYTTTTGELADAIVMEKRLVASDPSVRAPVQAPDLP